jgi:hypothetical protein
MIKAEPACERLGILGEIPRRFCVAVQQALEAQPGAEQGGHA